MTCDKKSGVMLQATCSCGTGWRRQTLPPRGSSLQTSCQRRTRNRQWSCPLHKRSPSRMVGVVGVALAASVQMLQRGELCHHSGTSWSRARCVPTQSSCFEHTTVSYSGCRQPADNLVAVTASIRQIVNNIIGGDADAQQPLMDAGLDSLGASRSRSQDHLLCT